MNYSVTRDPVLRSRQLVHFNKIMNYSVTRDPVLRSRQLVHYNKIMNYSVTRDPVLRSRQLVHYNISLTNNHIKSPLSLLSKLSSNCATNYCGFQLQLDSSQLQLQLGKNCIPN